LLVVRETARNRQRRGRERVRDHHEVRRVRLATRDAAELRAPSDFDLKLVEMPASASVAKRGTVGTTRYASMWMLPWMPETWDR